MSISFLFLSSKAHNGCSELQYGAAEYDGNRCIRYSKARTLDHACLCVPNVKLQGSHSFG